MPLPVPAKPPGAPIIAGSGKTTLLTISGRYPGIRRDTDRLIVQDSDIEIADGEIEVDEKPWKYSCEGGPNKLNIRIARGDVELFFGDTLYR